MEHKKNDSPSDDDSAPEKKASSPRVVVVIDDDWVTIKLLEHMLVQTGLKVHSAFDGAEGWEMIQRHHPDLVICDMLIPKIHGIEVCRKTKAEQSLKGIPVILMTGVYKGLSYNREIKDSGADGFIEKPIDVEKLTKLIRDLL